MVRQQFSLAGARGERRSLLVDMLPWIQAETQAAVQRGADAAASSNALLADHDLRELRADLLLARRRG